MIKSIYIIGLFLITGINSSYSQDYLSILKDLDYIALETLLSADVTVKVNNGDKIKGRKSGLSALKATLTEFAPVEIESRHKGRSGEPENNYQIVKLMNADGSQMRVFIHFENSAQGRRICDIKLRKLKNK